MKTQAWNYWKENRSAIVLAALFAVLAAFGAIPAEAGTLGVGIAMLGQTAMASFGPATFPTMEDFKNHLVVSGQQIEVIRQSLYDFQVYPTAGQAQMTFFALPVGQGLSASPGNANAVKALSDTNMTLAGQLPSPQGFFINSVEVDFQPGSVSTANTFTPQTMGSSAAAPAAATGIVQIGAANDVNAVIGSGALTLTIGMKPYLQEAPLFRFPTKARRELDAAYAGNSATTANFGASVARSAGRPYVLHPGLSLMTSMNFSVTLTWPVVVATPSTFNGRIGVILDGWLFRAVQ